MNKQKTILNFFSKSPATKPPASASTLKVESGKPCTPKTPNTAEKPPKTTQQSGKKRKLDPSTIADKASTYVKASPSVSTVGRQSTASDEIVNSSYHGNSDSEEDIGTGEKKRTNGSTKRRRILIASDSDESDYKPGKGESSDSSFEESNEDVSDTESPQKKKKNASKKTIQAISAFSNPKSSPSAILQTYSTQSPKQNLTPRSKKSKEPLPNSSKATPSDSEVKEWFHERLKWLSEYCVKDSSGKLISYPDRAPKCIETPSGFVDSQTPAMRQWWIIKKENFDTILFFKVGKFYELYHMDAIIGVRELGLVFMKGDVAHSGFPEIAYGRYSECLIDKGYKVARVEQTETPQMMEERCKKGKHKSYEKVVGRDVCQVTSKGTRTLTYQDESIGKNNNFLLALCEKRIDGSENSREHGICFIDTSIGKFTFGQFVDDRHGSRLLTLIALYPPVEVLCDNSVSKKTMQLLNHNLAGVTKQRRKFWNFSVLLKFLQQTEHFTSVEKNAGEDDSEKGEEIVKYPETISKMLDQSDKFLMTPLKQYVLSLEAFGGCLSYLKEHCIEDLLLSMKLFEEYVPVDEVPSVSSESTTHFKKHMVLDGVTLNNLEIVPLQPSGDAEGTLFGTMDYCSTAFGKRLLRNWMCSPLCNPDAICNRLDAIDDLIAHFDTTDTVVAILKKLPDLERLLSKIHVYGLTRSTQHPESRAIYYDADIYNKRKINDFLSTLQGFKVASEIVSHFEPHVDSFKSCLLKEITCSGSGNFPDMSQLLEYFDNAFDHDLAKKQGNIIPNSGVDEDYDSSCKDIDDCTKRLNDILEKQKKALNCKVTFVVSGKNRYMLEVPDKKSVPSEYEFQSGRKGFKRYYTKETKALIARLTAAEEKRTFALRNVTKRVFAHFDENYKMWKTAVDCLSALDVLVSLVLYCKSSGVTMCRPNFLLPSEQNEPFLKIVDGCHPTFLKYFTGDEYIPNSVYIGPKLDCEDETDNMNRGGKVVLVTGPNMGGKSTLMRQAGTLVIMAHMGSYVPAESMHLTPVDRIFTRVGASDQLSKGESTFYVEANETSSILQHATPHSFVLVDELGRGTSTFDGTAIAFATLLHLADEIGCRTLFSTHYHSLVEDVLGHPNVGLGHMACMVEEDNDCAALEKITFLYKFINGACPKSYGFNVALLAGIPSDIVHEGFLVTRQLEFKMRISRVLKTLLHHKTPEEIITMVSKQGIRLNVA